MNSDATTAGRHLPSVHTRFTLVVCAVLAVGVAYVAISGQAGPGASAWLAGSAGVLIALHAALVWFEDTRPGFRSSTVGKRLAALRLVALGVAFAGGLVALVVARAWLFAVLLTVLGALVVVVVVPALSLRVFGEGDAIAGGVRRPGVLLRDDSRVVTAAELEPGMKIVVGAGLRQLSPLHVEAVTEDEDGLHVRAHVDADAVSVLSFTTPPDAPVRVVHT